MTLTDENVTEKLSDRENEDLNEVCAGDVSQIKSYY